MLRTLDKPPEKRVFPFLLTLGVAYQNEGNNKCSFNTAFKAGDIHNVQPLNKNVMKGFTKDTYYTVQIVYEDYTDYMDMFAIEWTPREAIECMRNSPYHKRKLTETNVKEIVVSKVTKYEAL